MRSKDPRRNFARRTQIETLEERVVMSADPLGGLMGSVQQHALADDPSAGGAPIVEQHRSIVQQQAVEAPALGLHGGAPALSRPGEGGERVADFWIDPRTNLGLEDDLAGVGQSLYSANNQTGLNNVRANYGFRGGGQTVAVIDSGIAYTHYALGGGLGDGFRVVGGWDFTEGNGVAGGWNETRGDADPYDDGPNGGHGTHVAGIVGGDAGLNSGVAPDVDIVGLRVFDDAGNGLFSWVEEALDWVSANRNSFENPITAVNLSLGAEYNSDSVPLWAMLEDEFAQLEAEGIFISVSAGNSFQNFNTPGLSYPAASPYVVPVMSTDDSGFLSYFSQRNQRAIAAPGRFITSTVPDYAAGDANTINDDFASWSGTSMAAPYVAGSSVIIREAMEFVGTTNITQDMIYDLMMATADQFVDSATGLTYDRLNMEAAIDSLMPTDDYGSTAGTASSLGNISGVTSVSGVIAKLDDADYFTFTADMTGTVEFTAAATHSLDISWDGTGTVSGANGDVFTLDVVNGQTYTIGLSTDGGLGYYDLAVDSQSTFAFTEWGTVVFDQYNNVTGTGDTWYHIVASQGGFLTAEAFFSNAAGDVNLALYDANMQMQSSSASSADSERISITANSGDEFYLRVTGTNADIDFQLTNLVAVDGNTLNITGTDGDDVFVFAGGTTYNVQINGVSYDLDPATISTVNFDGGAGNDTATVQSSGLMSVSVTGVEQLSDFDAIAFALNDDFGLKTSSNDFLNWGGWGERWLTDEAGSWYFVTPSGEFYRWDGEANVSENVLIATLNAQFHEDLTLLTDATSTDLMVSQLAASIDANLELSYSGDYFENWGNWGEKWLSSADGTWYFLTTNGDLRRWDGNAQSSENELIGSLGTAYHTDPTLLFDAATEGSLNQATAISLDQQLGFALGSSTFDNWGGWSEKWVITDQQQWHFLTPSGALYRWNGGTDISGSTLVAVLDSTFYTELSTLYGADTASTTSGLPELDSTSTSVQVVANAWIDTAGQSAEKANHSVGTQGSGRYQAATRTIQQNAVDEAFGNLENDTAASQAPHEDAWNLDQGEEQTEAFAKLSSFLFEHDLFEMVR